VTASGGTKKGILRGEPAWPAPAKLNLFLHIVGRRPNGYHELQTCFQFVDLTDDIYLQVRLDGQIKRLRGAPGVDEDTDLCVRAARALQAATGSTLGVDIDVDKRIPMGAGLGGGSSDAATCLVALNRLWGIDWPLSRLAAWGSLWGPMCRYSFRVGRLGRKAWGRS
jgi:4-diphosphocytidyl-2-C-methyl-D-erythritol kinase